MQIHRYQYWTVVETQLKRSSAPWPNRVCRPCVDNGQIVFKIKQNIDYWYIVVIQFTWKWQCQISARQFWKRAEPRWPLNLSARGTWRTGSGKGVSSCCLWWECCSCISPPPSYHPLQNNNIKNAGNTKQMAIMICKLTQRCL